jgi:hypothetical protein
VTQACRPTGCKRDAISATLALAIGLCQCFESSWNLRTPVGLNECPNRDSDMIQLCVCVGVCVCVWLPPGLLCLALSLYALGVLWVYCGASDQVET